MFPRCSCFGTGSPNFVRRLAADQTEEPQLSSLPGLSNALVADISWSYPFACHLHIEEDARKPNSWTNTDSCSQARQTHLLRSRLPRRDLLTSRTWSIWETKVSPIGESAEMHPVKYLESLGSGRSSRPPIKPTRGVSDIEREETTDS